MILQEVKPENGLDTASKYDFVFNFFKVCLFIENLILQKLIITYLVYLDVSYILLTDFPLRILRREMPFGVRILNNFIF